MTLELKHSTGWFAAGREVARALEHLSDGAFKLYVYLCLNAQRTTARLEFRAGDLARALQKSPRSMVTYLAELEHKRVARIQPAPNQYQAGTIEIWEAWWPYRKRRTPAEPAGEAAYAEAVAKLFLACPCVAASFTEADLRLAVDFYRRGVSLEEIEQALLLGRSRKYQAEVNGKTPAWVRSLRYFESVVEEVQWLAVSRSYWEYLASKLKTVERQWLEKARGTAAGPRRSRTARAKFAEAKRPQAKKTR